MKNILTFSIVTGFICLGAVMVLAMPPALSNAATTCTPHASRQCVSNIAYWYNSCGALEEVAQNCNTTGQTCQNGQCVAPPSPSPTPTPTPSPTLTPTPALTPTPSPTVLPSPTPTATLPPTSQSSTIAVSIFGQKESNAAQWDKNINASTNDKINFLLAIKNTSIFQVDNVSVKTDITGNMVYTGNLKINNISSAGNVGTGISLGSIPPKTSKIISFSASVSPQTNQNTLQITATTTVGNILHDSDYVIINVPPQGTISPSPSPAENPDPTGNTIINNLRKYWYIWMAAIVVLIIIFIIIFIRVSSAA